MDNIEVGFHEVNPTYNIGDRYKTVRAHFMNRRLHWRNKLYG